MSAACNVTVMYKCTNDYSRLGRNILNLNINPSIVNLNPEPKPKCKP